MFFKDSLHTFIIRIFCYVFAFTVQVIIARVLGPGPKGEIQVSIFLLTVVALIIGMGMERSIIYFLGQGRQTFQKIWANAVSFLLISTFAGYLILIPLVYLIRPIFGNIRFELILLVFAVAPFDRLFSMQLGVFNGLGKLRKGNLFVLLQSFLLMSLVALMAYQFMPSSEGVLTAYIGSFALICIIVFVYWTIGGEVKPYVRPQADILGRMFIYGGKGQIGNIINVIARRIDLLIMNLFLGQASAGVYSAALNFGDLLLFLPYIISYVIFPHASRREEGQSWILTERATRLSFWFSIFLGLFLALAAPIMVPLIFSTDFTGAVRPLLILLPGMVFMASFRIMASGISGIGYPHIFSVCTVMAVAATLTLNLILVPRYQAEGAALASTSAYMLAFVSMLAFLRLKFKRSIKNFLIPNREDIIIIKDNILALLKRQARS